MMFRPQNDITPSILSLPDVPKQVDIDDLHDNGKLLVDAVINTIQEKVNHWQNNAHPDTTITRYSKHSFSEHNAYGLVTINDTLHAVYKGVKHDKHLGGGNFGRVKLAQNMKTGEWVAYKVQKTGDHFSNSITKRHNAIDDEHKHAQDMQLDRIAPHTHVSYKKQESQYNYAMAFAYGTPLKKLAESLRYKKKKTTFWLQLIIAILHAADILHTTHRKIHRDIKPDNIIINIENMTATLIDFGMTLTMPQDKTICCSHLVGAPLYVDYPHRAAFKQADKEKKPCKNKLEYSPATDTFAIAITIANILDLHIEPTSYDAFNPDNNYICKPGHPFFDDNTKIQDKKLLHDLVMYLDKITAHDLSARPTIKEAMTYFNALLQKQQNVETKSQIATLHVDDIIHLSAEEQQQLARHIANDANIWKVCLLDSRQRDIKTYLKLKRLFENADLPVCSYVLTHKNKIALIRSAGKTILKNENQTSKTLTCRHIDVNYILNLHATPDTYQVISDGQRAPRNNQILL